jgi:hypothetical protein
MRSSGYVGRAIVVGIGALTILLGFAVIAEGGASAWSGAWLVAIGLAIVVAALVERQRYRSDSAEAFGAPIGPGGGEPISEPIEGRFQRTGEVFIDPTSGHRMRVWLDLATGERRYRAEE